MSVSSIPMFSRDQARQFLLALPGIDPARVEEALQDPHGIRFINPTTGVADAFVVIAGGYEIVQDIDRFKSDQEETRTMKQESMQPMLIVGPRIEPDPNAPRRPSRTLSLSEQILAKRNTIVGPTIRKPFDPNNPADVASLVPEGYRLVETPVARLALSEKLNLAITGKSGSEPKVIALTTAAVPVERPRVAGTIDRSVIRADRAASERQAEEVAARCRAQNPSSMRPANDPAPSGPAVDRYVDETVESLVRPGTRLSTSKMSADKDPSRGVGIVRYTPEEIAAMSPYHRRAIQNAEPYKCRVCGRTGYSDRRRTLCDQHTRNGE